MWYCYRLEFQKQNESESDRKREERDKEKKRQRERDGGREGDAFALYRIKVILLFFIDFG